ncbi:TIGR04326 family surface carbohydrate biosynthesis protein [Sulfuritalea hydrogenivorans]|nr:TIGR04326 family surface carbohydrate biosynthesis protein [Sulfuritalea hydrogenivorans]
MPERSLKKSGNRLETLFVWDAEGSPPAGSWTAVLWRDFATIASPEVVSIPQLVEENADDLRQRYLAWVYELGETHIQGRRLVDHLELRPGFSYWWMTLFAEKCNYSKSPQIDNAIRLMALEKWASDHSFGRVVLASSNRSLADSVRLWCATIGASFEWRHMVRAAESRSWLKRLYCSMPQPVQALIWLARHLVDRWPLRGIGLREWRETQGTMAFVSYLDNMVPDAVEEGRFESRYWAQLPDTLQREGCKTNWLHLYVKDALLPTAAKAADVIGRLNKACHSGQTHVTLDAFLDIGVILATLRDWLWLSWTGWRVRLSRNMPRAGRLDLSPMFRKEWRWSMSGQTSMSNVLFLNLLESAMRSLPKQRIGVYLQENQGWEFALVHAWKALGHGRLIGSPHSTIRYWDLRYFFDRSCYTRTGDNQLPLPDQVALNGAIARDTYLTGDYPEGDLVEVEALRFLHLAEARAKAPLGFRPSESPLRVLVLGEYLPRNTRKQMRLLEKAAQYLPSDMVVNVKPHPNCPVQPADYPGLRMSVTMEPVSKLLAKCDVAYTSCVTSAAVDVYCAGVPVVSLLDPNSLNLSPLRGCETVIFASTENELASALISAASHPRAPGDRKNFFVLDPELPRWRQLLSEQFHTH